MEIIKNRTKYVNRNKSKTYYLEYLRGDITLSEYKQLCEENNWISYLESMENTKINMTNFLTEIDQNNFGKILDMYDSKAKENEKVYNIRHEQFTEDKFITYLSQIRDCDNSDIIVLKVIAKKYLEKFDIGQIPIFNIWS